MAEAFGIDQNLISLEDRYNAERMREVLGRPLYERSKELSRNREAYKAASSSSASFLASFMACLATLTRSRRC
jgi:hypothetical protein